MNEISNIKRRYTRLSDEDWSEIKQEWETGSTTLADLSDRFGASIRSMQNYFEKHGVVKGSAHRADLTAAVRLSAAQNDLASAGDTSPEAVKAATLRRVLAIEEAIGEQLDLARADPMQAFRCGSAVKMLTAAVDGLSKSYALKRDVLDLDRRETETKTVLVIRELFEEDVQRMRADDEDADDEIGPLGSDDDDIVLEEAA